MPALTYDAAASAIDTYDCTSGTAATDDVWGHWTTDTSITISTGSSSSTCNVVWSHWVSDTASVLVSATNATVHIDNVWGEWVNSGGGNCVTTGPPSRTYRPPPETEEQRAAREERQRAAAERRRKENEEWQRKEEERRRKLAVADKRAKVLFRDIFGDIEARRFEEKGHFELVGHSGTRYRLAPGRMIEVVKEKSGKDHVTHRLCIHHRRSDGLPPTDTVIHQALLVLTEDGEKSLKKTANKHAIHCYGSCCQEDRRRRDRAQVSVA